ncbi:MAG: ABC transporter permease subunit [Salinibacterium sp.]|nr:ABC transporter permease subunit [Salinibacterium sp.]
MSACWAIARREWASFFRTPTGWVVTALLCALGGAIVALTTFSPGAAASLRGFFDAAEWLLLPVVPAVSMKLLSEEHRTGTIDLIIGSPASVPSLILGKYLGGLLTLLTMLAPTLVYPAVLWAVADPAPDVGPLVSGYLSLVLLGAVYLAVGLAASAAASSQTLAFLATLFVLLAWLVLPSLRVEQLPEWLDEARRAVVLRPRVRLFARGAVPISDVVFLVVAAGWALTVAAGIHAVRRVR